MVNVYRENYKHKMTLKYIANLMSVYISSDYGFSVDVMKTFTPVKTNYLMYGDTDFGIFFKDILSTNPKIHMSYRVLLSRTKLFYKDLSIFDIEKVVHGLVIISEILSKKGVSLVTNSIDDTEVTIHIIDRSREYLFIYDNFLVDNHVREISRKFNKNNHIILYPYTHGMIKLYNMDSKSIPKKLDTKMEKAIIDFLDETCGTEFKYIRVKCSYFKLYTQRQFRKLQLNNLLI